MMWHRDKVKKDKINEDASEKTHILQSTSPVVNTVLLSCSFRCEVANGRLRDAPSSVLTVMTSRPIRFRACGCELRTCPYARV